MEHPVKSFHMYSPFFKESVSAVKMRLVKCETKHYETVLDNGLSASFTHLSRPSFMASFQKLGSLHQNKHYHYFFARHKTVSLIFFQEVKAKPYSLLY